MSTDRGKRVSDVIRLHIIGNGEGAYGKWVSARLSDGVSDGNLYDTKADAVRHALAPNHMAYFFILRDEEMTSPMGCEVYFRWIEQWEKAGYDTAHTEQHFNAPRGRN